MIDFMLLAAPRSGTTWAANWLTTDTTLCLHDPLWNYHYMELDEIVSTKRVGVSCTGLFLFPDWVNSHPARKIILHRPLEEINESLESIGLPWIDRETYDKLFLINGIHLPHTDLFESPTRIYEYLTGRVFDKERHDLLKEIEMQPKFSGLTIGKDVTRKLFAELQGI